MHYNYGDNKSISRRIVKLILMILITILISLLFLLSGIDLYSKDNQPIGIVIVTVGLVLLIIGGIYLRLYNQQTLTKIGFRDKRVTYIQYKTGYYAFVGSFYIMVYMLILIELNQNVRFVFYLGIGLNLLVFIGLYSILNKVDSKAEIIED